MAGASFLFFFLLFFVVLSHSACWLVVLREHQQCGFSQSKNGNSKRQQKAKPVLSKILHPLFYLSCLLFFSCCLLFVSLIILFPKVALSEAQASLSNRSIMVMTTTTSDLALCWDDERRCFDLDHCDDLDTPSVVTASHCCEEDYDDMSSVSSNASSRQEDQQMHQQCLSSPTDSPRSIFETYWSKEPRPSRHARIGCEQSQSPRSARATMMQRLEEPEMKEDHASRSTSSFYEQSLNHVERPKLSQRRWESSPLSRMFAEMFLSAPELDLESFGGRDQRKTKSTSALLRTPLRSSLRKGKFARGEGAGTASADATKQQAVSFRAQVDVLRFEVPKQSWAPEGWSSWFSH